MRVQFCVVEAPDSENEVPNLRPFGEEFDLPLGTKAEQRQSKATAERMFAGMPRDVTRGQVVLTAKSMDVNGGIIAVEEINLPPAGPRLVWTFAEALI